MSKHDFSPSSLLPYLCPSWFAGRFPESYQGDFGLGSSVLMRFLGCKITLLLHRGVSASLLLDLRLTCVLHFSVTRSVNHFASGRRSFGARFTFSFIDKNSLSLKNEPAQQLLNLFCLHPRSVWFTQTQTKEKHFLHLGTTQTHKHQIRTCLSFLWSKRLRSHSKRLIFDFLKEFFIRDFCLCRNNVHGTR